MKQKDYLDKVVEQLVSESVTQLKGRILLVPYSVLHQVVPLPSFPLYPHISSSFSNYVTKIYGLTEEEVKYVWEQYTDIINNRI